jgi:hypothetical protein
MRRPTPWSWGRAAIASAMTPGAPLSLLVIAVAVPMLLLVWPVS